VHKFTQSKGTKANFIQPKTAYSHLLSNGTNEIKCYHNG